MGRASFLKLTSLTFRTLRVFHFLLVFHPLLPIFDISRCSVLYLVDKLCINRGGVTQHKWEK